MQKKINDIRQNVPEKDAAKRGIAIVLAAYAVALLLGLVSLLLGGCAAKKQTVAQEATKAVSTHQSSIAANLFSCDSTRRSLALNIDSICICPIVKSDSACIVTIYGASAKAEKDSKREVASNINAASVANDSSAYSHSSTTKVEPRRNSCWLFWIAAAALFAILAYILRKYKGTSD